MESARDRSEEEFENLPAMPTNRTNIFEKKGSGDKMGASTIEPPPDKQSKDDKSDSTPKFEKDQMDFEKQMRGTTSIPMTKFLTLGKMKSLADNNNKLEPK